LTVSPLRFIPIDINKDLELAIAFRADSFLLSYGDPSVFLGSDGQGRLEYEQFIRNRVSVFPEGHVHVWKAGEIIGQIECIPRKNNPEIGYVNLFYLREDHRSKGLGSKLDAHVVKVLSTMHCKKLQLRVMPTNTIAIRFYENHGWRKTVDMESKSGELGMEKRL